MRFLFSLFFVFLIISPVLAQENLPKPVQHPSQELEDKRKVAEEKRSLLEGKANQINNEMTKTQKELVDIAGKVKVNEKRLNELDARVKAGLEEQSGIEKRLRRDKSSIGDLVLALERLNRTPPEAILARPGAPLETAQSAMLLQSILPDIYGRAERLKKDLSRLKELVAALEKDQADVKKTSEELSARQLEMSDLLKKRKKLYAETRQDIQLSDATLREIANEAKNLKDLVAMIEKRKAEEERTKEASLSNVPDTVLEDDTVVRTLRPTPIPKVGDAQLPVSGVIRVGFKQTNDIGAENQGLTIEARPKGLVVAPMGGVVRFAGYFKNYGQIIIVEHQKDYHSLIAGLARIDTVEGQSVASGEPVGILPKSSSEGGNPTLYYELRLNGEPVNPSRKFAGL